MELILYYKSADIKEASIRSTIWVYLAMFNRYGTPRESRELIKPLLKIADKYSVPLYARGGGRLFEEFCTRYGFKKDANNIMTRIPARHPAK